MKLVFDKANGELCETCKRYAEYRVVPCIGILDMFFVSFWKNKYVCGKCLNKKVKA